jgi:hypothetical protein
MKESEEIALSSGSVGLDKKGIQGPGKRTIRPF